MSKLVLPIDVLWRFWDNVQQGSSEQCWKWTGTIRKREGKNKDILYGGFSWEGYNYLAHRISYYIHKEQTELCILHSCDFGLCVNPNHLFAGTRRDNNIDCVSKLRQPGYRVLHETDVLFIYQQRGSISQKTLAEMFHVSPATVQAIHED